MSDSDIWTIPLGKMKELSRVFKNALDELEYEYGIRCKLVNNYPAERGEQYAILDEHGNRTAQRFGIVYRYSNENCYIVKLLAFDTKHSQEIYKLLNNEVSNSNLVFRNNDTKIDSDSLFRVLDRFVLTINPNFEELEGDNVPKKKKLTDGGMLKIGYGMLEIVDEEVWGPSKNFVELYGEIGGDYRQVRVYRDGSVEG